MNERHLLNKILEEGENEHIEMKRILTEKDLVENRKRKIIAQLRYITDEHTGLFVLGVEDINNKKWEIYGLKEKELVVSENILQKLCDSAKIKIKERIRVKTEKGFVGIYKLEQDTNSEIHMINVNFLGRVNAGKSTLIGVLASGRLDDGKGDRRSFLLKHPQELIKGQTADLHVLFLAFDEQGKPLYPRNPLSVDERKRILGIARKIATLVDAPGHEEFAKTMIRSVLGAFNQYGIVLIPVDDEYELIMSALQSTGEAKLDNITREHILLMISRETPFFIVLNKIDKVSEDKLSFVLSVVKHTLKRVGKIPLVVRSETDIEIVLKEIKRNIIVPILLISTVNGTNIDFLVRILGNLEPNISENILKKPALAYIDKIYRDIPGTNVVITGTIVSGVLKEGQTVKVGPDDMGNFYNAKIKSLEIFNQRVSTVMAGDVFGAELKKIDSSIIRRGQVIADLDFPITPVMEFDAQIIVTKHPTLIKKGYKPVLHCRTINQTVEIVEIYDKPYLVIGDTARVKLRFLRSPEALLTNDTIVLREANTRAVGRIIRLY
ncbi:MAG: 50S ribosome-binding GTPase [Candidatus Odinarchaeota archaeon]|nr:50S ribosome-binding GTPase [Candidatus Odinarchaeota archaeon]